MKNLICDMVSGIEAIFDKILTISFVVACIAGAFILLSVNFDVVTRYLVGRSQMWISEVVNYCLVFLTFAGAAWVLKKEGHVKIDIMTNMLTPKGQAMVNSITSSLAALIWLVATWYTGQLTLSLFQSGEHLATVVEPLKAPLIAIVPVGSFLLFIQSIRRTFGFIKSWKVPTRPMVKHALGDDSL